MARIVAIHGIAQEYKAPAVLEAEWLPSLRGGVQLAGGPPIADGDVVFPFYGDLFRPEGKAAGLPYYTADDVEPGFEEELLLEWWTEAARLDPAVQPPGTEGKGAGPARRAAFAALRALSASRFFTGITDRVMVFLLKQVHAYFHDDAARAEIQRRVAAAVSPDTQVIVGHSLGSVAAYEALCAHPEWPVRTLVTLGSPLGIRRLIFDRLRPAPRQSGPVAGTLRGAWPAGLQRWTNVADAGDVVALERHLAPVFDGTVLDVSIDNGATAHSISPYLTARQTGQAISAGLSTT